MAYHLYEAGTMDVDYTTSVERDFQLEEVRLHLGSAGGANSFTVTIDSAQGDDYDIVVNTQDMSAATDEHYQPTRPLWIRNGDQIRCEWTNGSHVQYGLEIIYR
jgi:hypothetical protein